MERLWQTRRQLFEEQFLPLLRRTALRGVPAPLAEASVYALSGKSKRLRPVLVLEAAELVGLAQKRALFIASALECLHSYSLVHDDLPAMDNDDFRRGQPSCHKKYGEATAILVGDLLHSASFELLARAELPPLAICYFARAIGAQGMVSGQFLDIQAEITDVRKLHRLKTGRLIEAALVLPQWAQGKFPPRRVVHWARALGLLFQITDDLLDATGDSGLLGKTAGKDAAQQKKTFVALLGKEGAHSEAARLASQLQQEAETLFPNSMLLQQLPQQLLNRKS